MNTPIRGLLCSKCKRVKEQNQFSKTQAKKGEERVCKECMNPSTSTSISPSQPKSSVSHSSSENTQKPSIFKPLTGAEGDKADKMICLTMHQPWASLLVHGIKRVEGRGWNTDFRGRLWIHAGKR